MEWLPKNVAKAPHNIMGGMDMLRGKCVVLGVTGSIAAYKIANLASALVKLFTPPLEAE